MYLVSQPDPALTCHRQSQNKVVTAKTLSLRLHIQTLQISGGVQGCHFHFLYCLLPLVVIELLQISFHYFYFKHMVFGVPTKHSVKGLLKLFLHIYNNQSPKIWLSFYKMCSFMVVAFNVVTAL